MTSTSSLPVPPRLLAHLRQLAPKRALTASESFAIARLQATRLRELLGITTPDMPLDWVTDVPRLTVVVVPAHQLGDGTSGFTTRKDGRYVIAVNKNTSRTHRRFTLAHEFKHLIDYPYAGIWHAGLGHGEPESRERGIERVADHFAAHVLMPTMLVKRAWFQGVQQPRLLSEVFAVSETAMRIRLDRLGLTGDDDLPAATYFRRMHFNGLAQTI
jgi:Zn-dependent peptidase ImmA (M78 family)